MVGVVLKRWGNGSWSGADLRWSVGAAAAVLVKGEERPSGG